MDPFSIIFSDDIILDEEAFQKASSDFEDLSTRLQNLNSEIEEMLTNLQKGFNTPAGRKFINSCRDNLRQPMSDQKVVLAHISETLAQIRQLYAPVFTEYDTLNRAIESYQHTL